MPRYARIHVSGGLFHVISRFIDRRFHLDTEGAREKYLEYLGKAAASHDARIAAYCLMSSHVHLVVQLGTDTLGKLMRKVHSPFGNWLNSRRKGFGTVWAERPTSVLVHSETYGLELIRYVHNNPVRAGVAACAADSDWSSHRAYLGMSPCPSWLCTDLVSSALGVAAEQTRKSFARFVENGKMEQRRADLSGEVSAALVRRMRKLMGGDIALSYPVLGPDEFVVDALKAQRQKFVDYSNLGKFDADEVVCDVFSASGVEISLAKKRGKTSRVAKARALAAWIWVEKMGRAQVEIAEALGIRPCTVSAVLTAMRRDGIKDEDCRTVDDVMNKYAQSETKPDVGAGAVTAGVG